MATQTRSVSGSNTIYTITDQLGVTCTVTAFPPLPGGYTISIATTGLHMDGVQMLSVLLIQLASEVQP